MSPAWRTRFLPARPKASSSLILLSVLGLLAVLACGKKGPPLPPLLHGPDRVSALSSRQLGKDIVLSGMLPDKNQDGGPLGPIQEVRVFRLDRGLAAGGPGGPARTAQRTAGRQFLREAKRIASPSGEALGKLISGRRFTYVDTNPLGAPPPETGRDLTYALTVVDAEKRSSPLSQLVSIRLLPPPLPPSLLREEVSEKKIRLSWEPPASQGKGETFLYNLYRSEEQGGLPEKAQNEKPLPQPFFDDSDFSFGKNYTYVVRTVVVEKGSVRESEDSLPLKVSPVDVYAPAAPTGLAVSAEGDVIKLYWFPNSETDLGGYRVYRSEKEGEGFQPIATLGPAESTYVDSSAKRGVKYYYAVSALDQNSPPNESARSEVHGDRLPPAKPAPEQKPPAERR